LNLGDASRARLLRLFALVAITFRWQRSAFRDALMTFWAYTRGRGPRFTSAHIGPVTRSSICREGHLDVSSLAAVRFTARHRFDGLFPSFGELARRHPAPLLLRLPESHGGCAEGVFVEVVPTHRARLSLNLLAGVAWRVQSISSRDRNATGPISLLSVRRSTNPLAALAPGSTARRTSVLRSRCLELTMPSPSD